MATVFILQFGVSLLIDLDLPYHTVYIVIYLSVNKHGVTFLWRWLHSAVQGLERMQALKTAASFLRRTGESKNNLKMMVSVTTRRIYDDDFSMMIFKDELWTPYRARCR